MSGLSPGANPARQLLARAHNIRAVRTWMRESRSISARYEYHDTAKAVYRGA
jgi:hypothetical protein